VNVGLKQKVIQHKNPRTSFVSQSTLSALGKEKFRQQCWDAAVLLQQKALPLQYFEVSKERYSGNSGRSVALVKPKLEMEDDYKVSFRPCFTPFRKSCD
jgi:hypothetical protein